MKLESQIFGTTPGGWIIREPPSMTNRASYAFLIEKAEQRSILEYGKGHWRYMLKFDTSIIPPNRSRDFDLLSIRGTNVKRSNSLTGALQGLGLSKDEVEEAVKIIDSAR